MDELDTINVEGIAESWGKSDALFGQQAEMLDSLAARLAERPHEARQRFAPLVEAMPPYLRRLRVYESAMRRLARVIESE